jgi:hypothetical protein
MTGGSDLHLPAPGPERGDPAPRLVAPLARVGPVGTLPTDSRAVSGPSTRDTARAWWGPYQVPCLGPASLAPAGSVPGSRRGPSSAWLRPRFSPAFPGPTHDEGSGCSGGSLSCRPGLAPRASCGATFGGWQSETWPGGFAQAGQSRGPGSDRPGSSTRALLPRHLVTPGGDTFAARPLVPKRPRCECCGCTGAAWFAR